MLVKMGSVVGTGFVRNAAKGNSRKDRQATKLASESDDQ